MSTVLVDNFKLNTNLQLDDRSVVADITARNALDPLRRYVGLVTYVIAVSKSYQLQGGIADANWVDVSGTGIVSTVDTLTAHAGGGQTLALALTSQINRITTVATAGDSVKLPAATAGAQIMVINGAAANSMNIFPVSGEAIDSLGTNSAYPLTVTSRNVTFVCVTAGSWISKAGGAPKSATDSITAFAGGGQSSATVLSTDINRVTTVASNGDSVKLPISAPGAEVIVINDGVATLNVYPQTGDAINGLTANIPFAIDIRTKLARFICAGAGLWRSSSFRDTDNGDVNFLDNGNAEDGSTGFSTYASVQGFPGSSVNTTTDVITITGHGLSEQARVQFTTSSGLPGGLTALTDYYLKAVTTNTFQVSLTPGGTAVDLTSAGTGVHGLRPARPVALAGTATGMNWSFSQSSPLERSTSFLVSVTGGNMGDGAYKAFTIPEYAKGKPCTILFDSILISGTYGNGTSSTDTDLIYMIYDVTNGVFIQPSNYKIDAVNGVLSERYRAEFQAPSNSTSFRLVWHMAYGTASYNIRVDNIYVGLSKAVYASGNTDWAPCTITGSWVSNTTYVGKFRRIGGNNEYQVKIATTGAPTSAALTLTIPHTIDTAQFPATPTVNTILTNPKVDVVKSGGSTYPGSVYYNSTNSVGVSYFNSSGGVSIVANVTQAAPITFASGDSVDVSFSVPILGQQSTLQMSDQISTRIMAMTANNKSITGTLGSSDTIAIFQSVDKDTHSAYNAATGQYKVQTPGWFLIHATIGCVSSLIAGNTIAVSVYVNGVSIKQEYLRGQATPGASGWRVPVIALIYCNADDLIDIRCSSSGSSNSYSSSSSTLFIARWSGSSQTAANEKFLFSGYLSVNTALTANVTDIPMTALKDTHGAWSGSSYKTKSPGDYQVNMTAFSASSGATLKIYLNGVVYRQYMQCNVTGVNTGCAILENLPTDSIISVRADSTMTLFGGLPSAGALLSIFKIPGAT